jgi:hypothetical protein
MVMKFCMHHAEFVAVQNLASKFSSGVVLQFNADFKMNRAPGYVMLLSLFYYELVAY